MAVLVRLPPVALSHGWATQQRAHAEVAAAGVPKPGHALLRLALESWPKCNTDTHTNLWDPVDAIGSVANYLAQHGWQRGVPTHFAVKPPVDTADRAALLAPDILPSFTAAQMAERGAVLDAAGAAHTGLLALVELQNGDAAPSYVAGTKNFWVVTRYNWSSYYALAVIELGEAIKANRALSTMQSNAR